jgi:hypothetical protein
MDQVRHLLDGASLGMRAPQDRQLQEAAVMALLLIAQELDQIGDCLAVTAGLKDPGEAEIT